MRLGGVVLLLAVAVITLQVEVVRRAATVFPRSMQRPVMDMQSGAFTKRAALSYNALVADAYWIGTLQYYGRTKLSNAPNKQYDMLYPLLDVTTTVDPHFEIAYRFGAIFLAEPPPAGPGRPDLAIALLKKGLQAQPATWEFAEDIGFVYYWWVKDYTSAAEWFTRAARTSGAPDWLSAMAAVTLAEGGNRAGSRRLWQEVLATPNSGWLHAQARFRLAQFDALEQIDALEGVRRAYEQHTGTQARSWTDLIRAGYLRGVPADPQGHPYYLDADSGAIALSSSSGLNPLPSNPVRK